MKAKTRAILCAVGAILCYALVGGSYTSVVLFIDPVCTRLGCTATEFSFIFTAIGLGMIVGGFFVGNMFEKMNPKIIGLIGTLHIPILFGTMALANSIVWMWVAGFIFGMQYNMLGTTMMNILLSNWFDRGRATILGFGSTAANVFAIVLTPTFATLIVNYGMKSAVLWVGLAFTVLLLISCLFLICKFPAAYGMKPVNIGKETADPTAQAQEKGYEVVMPPRKIAFSKVYLLIILTITLLFVANTTYYNNSIPIYMGMGLEYQQASYVNSFASFGGMVLTTVLGLLCDKIGSKRAIVLYMVIACVLFCSAPLLHGFAGAMILAAFISCVQCASMLAPLVIVKLYGTGKSAVLLGWVGIATGIGSMIGSPVANMIAEVTGTFNAALVAAGIVYLAAIAAVLYLFSEKAVANVRKKDEAYRAEMA